MIKINVLLPIPGTEPWTKHTSPLNIPLPPPQPCATVFESQTKMPNVTATTPFFEAFNFLSFLFEVAKNIQDKLRNV